MNPRTVGLNSPGLESLYLLGLLFLTCTLCLLLNGLSLILDIDIVSFSNTKFSVLITFSGLGKMFTIFLKLKFLFRRKANIISDD